MTDKEFKRLSRAELIDIIYQLQLKQDELIADNRALIQKVKELEKNSGTFVKLFGNVYVKNK